MRKQTLLALLGLLSYVSAEEEGHAAEEDHAAAIQWFWRAEDADASEQKAIDESPPNEEGGVILSACFGLQSCAGFQQDDQELIYSAREWECKVGVSQTETGRKDDTSAQPLTDLNYLCPNLLPVAGLARPYDIMPTTFNFPVQYETLDINGDDFVVTLADGTFTRPVCAILDPAFEPSEMHTVALVGHFGGRDEGTWPSAIEVVEDTLKLYDNENKKVISAKGLRLERETGGGTYQMGDAQYGHSMSYESGLVMLKAWAFEFTMKGEGELMENHCRVDWPATTHVIRILFNGGPSKDGIHPLLPSDTSFFSILLPRARTLLWNKFIGLADLGEDEVWKEWPEIYETDGDNYLDLCLQLTESDNIEDIQSVLLQENVVFPPRGTGRNIAHMVRVEHPAADVYPYVREMETAGEKIFWFHFWEIFEIVALAVGGGFALFVPPICGTLLGTGLLFLEAYVQLDF